MGISKFNAGKKVDWDIDTKDWKFKKPSELVIGQVYDLKGFFITQDKGFGKGAALITDGYLVNTPSRYVDIISNMLNDEDIISDVKAGKCAFKIYTFQSDQFKRTGYGIEFIEK